MFFRIVDNSFAIRTRPVRTKNGINDNKSADNTNQTDNGNGITCKCVSFGHNLIDLLFNHSTFRVLKQVTMDTQKSVHCYTYVVNYQQFLGKNSEPLNVEWFFVLVLQD